MLHRRSAIWPLHDLHHSADVMTLVNACRHHPLILLIGPLVDSAVVGLLSGLATLTPDRHWRRLPERTPSPQSAKRRSPTSDTAMSGSAMARCWSGCASRPRSIRSTIPPRAGTMGVTSAKFFQISQNVLGLNQRNSRFGSDADMRQLARDALLRVG